MENINVVEKRDYFSFRGNITDVNSLKEWSKRNDLTVAYCLRRAVKDFINKYVETNTIPPAEKVNFGAVKGKDNVWMGDNKNN